MGIGFFVPVGRQAHTAGVDHLPPSGKENTPRGVAVPAGDHLKREPLQLPLERSPADRSDAAIAADTIQKVCIVLLRRAVAAETHTGHHRGGRQSPQPIEVALSEPASGEGPTGGCLPIG